MMRLRDMNKIIIPMASITDKAKIIVFNPNPEKVIQNLSDNIENHRVIKIRQKFGTPAGVSATSNLLRYVSIARDDEY